MSPSKHDSGKATHICHARCYTPRTGQLQYLSTRMLHDGRATVTPGESGTNLKSQALQWPRTNRT
eukprot:11428060-Alexandrium_andersonii.AAC.1